MQTPLITLFSASNEIRKVRNLERPNSQASLPDYVGNFFTQIYKEFEELNTSQRNFTFKVTSFEKQPQYKQDGFAVCTVLINPRNCKEFGPILLSIFIDFQKENKGYKITVKTENPCQSFNAINGSESANDKNDAMKLFSKSVYKSADALGLVTLNSDTESFPTSLESLRKFFLPASYYSLVDRNTLQVSASSLRDIPCHEVNELSLSGKKVIEIDMNGHPFSCNSTSVNNSIVFTSFKSSFARLLD